MTALITRRRVLRLTGFASSQVAVQAIGFASGIVLVRCMEPVQYGYYTLAVTMASVATILSDLGLATAVLAIGGRLGHDRIALGQLNADADALHRRLAWLALAVVGPCAAALLWHQQAASVQIFVLTAFVVAMAAVNVPTGVALSISRLLGRVGLQQRLDLGVNVVKLGVLSAASWLAFDAAIACLINLVAAIVYYLLLARALDVDVDRRAGAGEHVPAIRRHVGRLAPNAIYFVVSSQLAVWLIGIFGSAERVAEVGALGRLAALFSLVAAVSATLVLPYFARRDAPAELIPVFVGINLFFAGLLLVLAGAATAFPDAILWVLGASYGGLRDELVWMVVATTLSAWGGTIYSVGCARGWVMPIGIVASVGVVATAVAASLVDVATVRGSFMINTVTGLAATVAAIAYFGRQLQRHARPKAALP